MLKWLNFKVQISFTHKANLLAFISHIVFKYKQSRTKHSLVIVEGQNHSD